MTAAEYSYDPPVPLAYKFTGKERDSESGLDFFGARFYANRMGRWMSPDWASHPAAVPYAEFGDPQSLNMYGYVRDNPVANLDANGHKLRCMSSTTSSTDVEGKTTFTTTVSCHQEADPGDGWPSLCFKA